MATAVIDKILAQVSSWQHDIVEEVSNLVNGPKPAASSGTDLGWHPDVPVGHTAFSWRGETPVPRPQAAAQSSESAAATATETSTAEAPAAAAAAAPASAAPPAANAKKGPKPAKAAPAAAAPVNPDQSPLSRLDIRVGRIVKAWKHPDADSLYVEEIDIGEATPRQIVSGLVKFIPEDQMQGAECLVIANLKPSPLRGVKSFGMVMCASDAEKTVVQFCRAPAGTPVGTRVVCAGEDAAVCPPDAQIDPKKDGNVWNQVKPLLTTNGEGVAYFGERALVVPGGSCTSTVLNGILS